MEKSGLLEHERHWRSYFRGIDSRTNDHDDHDASACRGFISWLKGFFYRGYAQDDDGTPYEDDVYLCPLAWAKYNPIYWLVNLVIYIVNAFFGSPRELRGHEAGHTVVFGRQFRTILAMPTPQGGLPHEPTSTLDVMLEGKYSFLRLTDRRGILPRYDEWVATGLIRRVRE